MLERTARANSAKSYVRARVEQAFVQQSEQVGRSPPHDQAAASRPEPTGISR